MHSCSWYFWEFILNFMLEYISLSLLEVQSGTGQAGASWLACQLQQTTQHNTSLKMLTLLLTLLIMFVNFLNVLKRKFWQYLTNVTVGRASATGFGCSSAYKHKMIQQSVWWTDTRTFVKDFKKEKEEFYLSLGRSGQLYLAELHSLVQSYILIDLRTENRQNIRAEQRVFRCSRLYSTVSNLFTHLST